MVNKYQMSCCAMCQFTATDEDSIEEISYRIEELKREAKLVWNFRNRDSGERNILMVTTPSEKILERNLKKLGFKMLTTMNRRNGYPEGKIKLWYLGF